MTEDDVWMKGYMAGLAAAYLRSARIADGHRAMALGSGHTVAGVAASAVAAFIIEAARDAGVWNETLNLPLVNVPSSDTA